MAISVISAGDSLMTQRLAKNDKTCLALKELLESFDARFTNFELTVHDFEASPSAVSGGTWVAAPPAVVKDLNWLGINMYAVATNHALDWGHDGLLTTIRHLKEADCVFAGAGRNLAEANMPAYLDTPEGRVALISICSTAKDWNMAGEQRPDVPGRPGINVLRFNTVHYLPQEDLELLRAIIGKTDVNARRMQLEREGWAKTQDGFAIENIRFEAGEAGTKTSCNKADLDRISRAVSEGKRQADVVLVSHHVHEYRGSDKAVSSDFQREFARLCIDNGAHAYLGHGPHILRGIEVYRNRPIFYSLGDFFLQNESIARQPAEFYDTYGLGPENTPADGFEARSANGSRGLAANSKAFESVMAGFSVDGDAVSAIELIPITLNFGKPRSRKGRPELADEKEGMRILRELQKLSDEYGTKIEIAQGRGYIRMR